MVKEKIKRIDFSQMGKVKTKPQIQEEETESEQEEESSDDESQESEEPQEDSEEETSTDLDDDITKPNPVGGRPKKEIEKVEPSTKPKSSLSPAEFYDIIQARQNRTTELLAIFRQIYIKD